MLDNISNTHFLHLLLYVYGPPPPAGDKETYTRNERDRMGIGFYMPLQTTYAQEPEGAGAGTIYAKSVLESETGVDKALIKKMTGQEALSISHLTKGVFNRNAAGELTAASMEIFEQIADDNKSDLYLTLETLNHETYGGGAMAY